LEIISLILKDEISHIIYECSMIKINILHKEKNLVTEVENREEEKS
jgi:hypothetical protein